MTICGGTSSEQLLIFFAHFGYKLPVGHIALIRLKKYTTTVTHDQHEIAANRAADYLPPCAWALRGQAGRQAACIHPPTCHSTHALTNPSIHHERIHIFGTLRKYILKIGIRATNRNAHTYENTPGSLYSNRRLPKSGRKWT